MTLHQRLPDYLPRLISLALPIAAQVFMTTSVNVIDTIMVGQLGVVEIGAIALGNQVFFLLMLFLLGVGSGGAVFASQFWGAKNVAGVRAALGISLMIAAVGAALFTVATVGTPRLVLSAFTADATLIDTGAAYLRIVGLSYFATAATMTFAHAVRSVGDTRTPMVATAVSITVNIVGNWILIFGRFGIPALGVRGAAIATAIARVVELAVILAIVYRRRGPLAATPRELFAFDRPFLKRFLGRSMPVVINEILWSLGFTMYTVVFARMGTEYLAAYNVADTVGRLALVLFIGTGQASAILIGNTIGAGGGLEAREMGRSIMRFAVGAAAVTGIVVVVALAPIVPRFFAVDAATARLVTQFLRLYGMLIVLKAGNIHVIVGILRGGGDTHYALTIDIAPLWLVGVPATMITGLVLGWPPPAVYAMLMAEEGIRLALGWRRIFSGRWVHDLTHGDGGDAGETAHALRDAIAHEAASAAHTLE